MGRSTTASRPGVALAKVGLIAAMAIGSVLMWLGLPLGLVYLASRLSDSSQPSMGPYLLIIFGLPIGMVAIGKALASLDRRYARITHTEHEGPVRRPWLKSMRGERGSDHQRTVLDVVMIVSVGVALLLLALWFFVLAGSSLPG